MKISVWVAETLAEKMREHDNPQDDSLKSAYVDLERIEIDGSPVIVARWEDGGHIVIWHDGTDVTADFPEFAR